MPVIMGTAGHIDHGKTTLVRTLTGIDCDRLAEEKKRGITIELGFAFHDLANGERLSIVDVPGHEKFVKNMVAGAAGIDFVLLVIAADEGVMPQTREHLEICSLLGISTGLVALTKTDMVDEEWLELVTEDVRGFLQGTFLEEADILPVSSQTGEGMDALRAALDAMAANLGPRRRTDMARLPVDRVFTMTGHGTVVTGTLVSGTLSVGQEIRVYPGDTTAKVRGLQSHGATVETAPAGRRTAVNLQGLEVSDLERGEVLSLPGTLFPSQVWDLELTCLSSSPRPIRHRTEIHFHHGSREILARLYFLDRDKLAPGDTALCQVRFPEPLPGVFDDRCVVRAYSPLRTVAGGRIINPMGRRAKSYGPERELLAALAGEDDAARLQAQLDLAGHVGLSMAELRIMSNLETKALDKLLQDLGGKQQVLLFDKEERRYVGGNVAEAMRAAALEFLAAYHKREPMKAGLSRGAVAGAWDKKTSDKKTPEKLAHFLLERMLKQNDIATEQDLLKLPDHVVSMASDTAGLRDAILDAYTKGHIMPPNLTDVLGDLGVDKKQAAPVLRLLQDENKLVRLRDDMYYTRAALDDLVNQLRGFFADHEDMVPSDFRDLTGLTRKYLIPVLEHFDKEKITMRVGDARRLRGK